MKNTNVMFDEYAKMEQISHTMHGEHQKEKIIMHTWVSWQRQIPHSQGSTLAYEGRGGMDTAPAIFLY